MRYQPVIFFKGSLSQERQCSGKKSDSNFRTQVRDFTVRLHWNLALMTPSNRYGRVHFRKNRALLMRIKLTIWVSIVELNFFPMHINTKMKSYVRNRTIPIMNPPSRCHTGGAYVRRQASLSLWWFFSLLLTRGLRIDVRLFSLCYEIILFLWWVLPSFLPSFLPFFLPSFLPYGGWGLTLDVRLVSLCDDSFLSSLREGLG